VMQELRTSEKYHHLQGDQEQLIVALTAATTVEDKNTCFNAGANFFIAKPLDKVNLLAALYKCVITQEQATTKIVAKTALELDCEKLAGKKVLVVDDEILNRKIVSMYLQEIKDIDITTADDGQEAVTILADTVFDIVVLDMQMPNKDGYSVMRELRNDPAYAHLQGDNHLPIVAFTAHAMKGDKEKCLETGADDYISKPAKKNDFIAVLAKNI
jgi:two-component system, sensor histidine kinase and response regulator